MKKIDIKLEAKYHYYDTVYAAYLSEVHGYQRAFKNFFLKNVNINDCAQLQLLKIIIAGENGLYSALIEVDCGIIDLIKLRRKLKTKLITRVKKENKANSKDINEIISEIGKAYKFSNTILKEMWEDTEY